MRENGIKTKKKFKATTNSKHDNPVAANRVNQNFTVTEANRVWVSDVTYLWTKEGWLYLAVVIDLFSRMVVGWAMDAVHDAGLIIKALGQAIGRRKPGKGIIFHSDRGSQYTSSKARMFLERYAILSSMGRKGDCYDNAVCESFFHTLKVECIYREDCETRVGTKTSVFEYIEVFYNRERIHSTIGYKSPVDYEKSMNLLNWVSTKSG
jgi:transposase InsO family protein